MLPMAISTILSTEFIVLYFFSNLAKLAIKYIVHFRGFQLIN